MRELDPSKALIYTNFDKIVQFEPNECITNTQGSQTGKLPLYGVPNYGGLDLSPKYLQLGGGVNILVDGNMEAADASAWTIVNNAVVTKQPDSRFGQCLRVANVGTGGPQAYQNILTKLKTYRIRGYARASINGQPCSILVGSAAGNVVVNNTTEWKYFDFTKIVPSGSGTWFYFFGGGSNGVYVEYAQVSVEEVTASTTYPTLLPNEGMNFDGANVQRINCGNIWKFNTNTPFSVNVSYTPLLSSSGNVVAAMQINNLNAARFRFWHDTVPLVQVLHNNVSRSYNSSATLSPFRIRRPGVYTWNFAGQTSGLDGYDSFYANGKLLSFYSPTSITMAPYYNNFMLIGVRHDGASSLAAPFYGKLHHLSIFPYTLSSSQIYNLHNQIKKRFR